ncbi:MAG TPA: discoidin domain-containing protein [Candidatus Binatia bacterium]|nr:discoidin domain-containing protein [Candidatus Binatia bacterium]
MVLIGLAAVAALLAARTPARGEARVLDDFEDPSGWAVSASEGSRAWITSEPGRTGAALRVGFDINPGGGYILIHKSFALSLPDNYAFGFWLRGEGPANNFEFKLIDARSRSVWWRRQRDWALPTEWQLVTVRKSRMRLAWGANDGPLKQVGAIELAISAGEGGTGSFVIDELTFEERERADVDGVAPAVTASTSAPGENPASVLDGLHRTGWHTQPLPREQWLLVDFGRNREFGGLVIDWDPEDWASAFGVDVSTDGETWTNAYRTTTGRGGRDYIYMPDAESRYVRLTLQRSARGRGYGITAIRVEPVEFSESPNRFFEAIARDARMGDYPKYLYDLQTYWTVVGVPGDDKCALLNEEGMLEVDKGQFSIEPFLYTDDGLVTWGAVGTEQHLRDALPIPSVVWKANALRLTTTAFAAGEPGKSVLWARYRVENRSESGLPVTLFLAVRPFQVNPPWQTVNTTGGVTHIQDVRFDGRVVWVNRDRAVVSLTTPDQFGAGTFEDGAVTHFLGGGRVPPHPEVSDPHGFASAALRYNLYLEAHGHAEVDLAIPFHEPRIAALTTQAGDRASAIAAEREEEVRRSWARTLGGVELQLPPDGTKVVDTLRSTLGYILVNRDGAGLHPGPRNYARSWIRDGAMTSAALLSMGFTEEPREFLRWYAGFQGADGKVPCCVDRRGADPTPEHDSAGAFVWAVAEYYRYTRDVGFLAQMWPHVVRAVDYLGALRRRRTTDEYRTPEKEPFFGLLPESISHEGYSGHPVHSFWDDFFALRAVTDAAELAVVVGDDEHAASIAALRDAFHESVHAAVLRTIERHHIDYVPGSVELGDFDPTSTSIAIAPGGQQANLPAAALARTYDRYWQEFVERRDGVVDWQDYSPYELRNVGTLVRLGQRDRALELLRWFLADQRPAGWNAWAEIAWRDPEAPRFIGDMPHAWVGAGFVTSVRTLFAYERETDEALVLGAGVPAAWVTADPGVVVKRLPTYWGVLGMTMRATGPDAVRVRLTGDLTVPPGRIVLRSPLSQPLRGVVVNGRSVESFTTDEVVIGDFPAEVTLKY